MNIVTKDSTRVKDSSDMMYYATDGDPVYWINNTSLEVYPTPTSGENAKVYYVYLPAVAYGDSAISYFLTEAEYLVVNYASIKSLNYLMNQISNDELDLVTDFADANNWLNTEEDSEMVNSRISVISSQINDFNTKINKIEPAVLNFKFKQPAIRIPETMDGLPKILKKCFSMTQKYTDLKTVIRDTSHDHAFFARFLYNKGMWEEAKKEFLAAIDLEPDNPIHYSHFAHTLFGRKYYEDAIYWWQKQKLLDPRDERPYLSKANGFIKLKRFDDALRELRDLIALYPANIKLPKRTAMPCERPRDRTCRYQ